MKKTIKQELNFDWYSVFNLLFMIRNNNYCIDKDAEIKALYDALEEAVTDKICLNLPENYDIKDYHLIAECELFTPKP